MTGPEDIGTLVDRLGQVALECRAMIVEAHQAIKDLRQATREAEQLVATLVAPMLEERVDAEVRAGLEAYKETLRQAIDSATASVYDRFDTLANVMMGKGDAGDFEAAARRKLANRAKIPNGREAVP